MGSYILYGRGESGNSYKAALMLSLCALDWKPRLVGFFTDETKAVFRTNINELGEIPVLEHGDMRLSQTGVILSYLADHTGSFAGRNAEERLEILRWILFDNHRFSSYFATLRFMVGLRKTGETPVTEFLRTQALASFAVVEDHLNRQPFLVSDRPTIADISMVGYRYYDEETGIDFTRFPRMKTWTERIKALPGWAHPYDLLPRASVPATS